VGAGKKDFGKFFGDFAAEKLAKTSESPLPFGKGVGEMG
jgi:hypothetical protein